MYIKCCIKVKNNTKYRYKIEPLDSFRCAPALCLCALLLIDHILGRQRILLASLSVPQFAGVEVFDAWDELSLPLFLFDDCTHQHSNQLRQQAFTTTISDRQRHFCNKRAAYLCCRARRPFRLSWCVSSRICRSAPHHSTGSGVSFLAVPLSCRTKSINHASTKKKLKCTQHEESCSFKQIYTKSRNASKESLVSACLRTFFVGKWIFFLSFRMFQLAGVEMFDAGYQSFFGFFCRNVCKTNLMSELTNTIFFVGKLPQKGIYPSYRVILHKNKISWENRVFKLFVRTKAKVLLGSACLYNYI